MKGFVVIGDKDILYRKEHWLWFKNLHALISESSSRGKMAYLNPDKYSLENLHAAEFPARTTPVVNTPIVSSTNGKKNVS